MNATRSKYGHVHAEAFMLMTYACRMCHHAEIIWNSRDGVTPFGLNCPSCGQPTMLHVNWEQDVYAPQHKLHRHQKFWRDGTPDEAAAIMRTRIQQSRKAGLGVDVARAIKLEDDARNGKCHEFQPGWPTLAIHMGDQ